MPIVEPDISLNGDYDLETAIRVNVKVQAHLYKVSAPGIRLILRYAIVQVQNGTLS